MKDDPWYMERKSRELQKELEKKIEDYIGYKIRLFRFIIGIIGITTVLIGVFTFIVLLFLPYDKVWGYLITAFAIPFLIIFAGTIMIYYGLIRGKK